MLSRPVSVWSTLLAVGAVVLGVFIVLGYGLVLLPMLLLGAALLGGAALYRMWGEED
jgi:hypothetical protein